ncbi:sensor domain-containing protein [Mycobacterium sp.]|uniref:sensor domain-containing protein n=1 Tax=Mycobacterium sp. TaxID=1785 RepID=UPI0025EBF0C0|nr:sensor domain-containing protein [Mycobacterium sp.]MBW0015674.1 sensor domain-containing protein [Mycobacterium sp.]
MAVFVSYSSQDRSALDALLAALRRGQQQVWFDQELGGGDAWWAKICEQIRSCDVFIIALSNNWLRSKPSQAELRYAQALGRPILPVRIGAVDSMRVNPVATLQIIDYRDPSVEAGIQLVTAVHALQAKPQPLPDPLPEEPPVPFGYITRMGNVLAEKELSPQQQLQLLVELRSGLEEDGDDPSARSDIAQLLRMMRLRHDVTYRTRTEIDNALASLESAESDPSTGASATSGAAAPAGRTGAASQAPGKTGSAASGAAGGGAAAGGRPNRRLLVIGGSALTVVIAIVVVVVLATQGGSKKSPATAQPAAPAAPGGPQPAAPGTPAAPGAPAAAPGRLDSILISAQQVNGIMNPPMPMQVSTDQTASRLRPDEPLSNSACYGAFDPIRESAYAGYTPTGVLGQGLDTQDNSYRVYQAAVSFSTAAQAQEFVTASAGKWKACNGLTVKYNNKANWTFGNVADTPSRITLSRTPGDPSRASCERVLSAVSDVVLDIMACEVGVQDQGGQIADAMAANVR